MKIKPAEDAIVTKLQEAFPELEVIPYPDRAAEYELIHPLGSILVKYDSSTFEGDAGLSMTAQPKRMKFMVVSLTRSLRSHCGCYEVLGRIREALLGFKMLGFDQIKIDSEEFVDEDEGVWTYMQTFSVRTFELQGLSNFRFLDPFYQ